MKFLIFITCLSFSANTLATEENNFIDSEEFAQKFHSKSQIPPHIKSVKEMKEKTDRLLKYKNEANSNFKETLNENAVKEKLLFSGVKSIEKLDKDKFDGKDAYALKLNNLDVWLEFYPENHPASPAVVQTSVHQYKGYPILDVSMLCEGVKEECDKLDEQNYQGLLKHYKQLESWNKANGL